MTKEGFAAWKGSSSENCIVYYATDGMRHGQTPWKWKASVVTEDEFKYLLDLSLIPPSAKFVEGK